MIRHFNDTLSWAALDLRGAEIPWSDLEALADAAVQSSDVRARLMREFDQPLSKRSDGDKDSDADLTDLGVCGVFALAAERLDGPAATEVAEFLVRALRQAGEQQDDGLLETILQSAGRLGAPLVDPGIKLLEQQGYDLECWFHLFGLLGVARDADVETQQKVIRCCREVVSQAPDGNERFSSVFAPAQLLASLDDQESLEPLRAIHRQSHCPEIGEAIDELCGTMPPYPELMMAPWKTPVRTWLPDRARQMRKGMTGWVDDCLIDETEAREPAGERYGALVRSFLESPEAQNRSDTDRRELDFAVTTFLSIAWDELGTALEEVSGGDVQGILIDNFPRQAVGDDEFFQHAASCLVSFFQWCERRGAVSDARTLCDSALEAADEMLRRSRDTQLWSPAKAMHMRAQADGVDSSDPEALAHYAVASLLVNSLPPAPPPDPYDTFRDNAPETVVRDSPRVGRNQPCPCGSGKKYKKCCSN